MQQPPESIHPGHFKVQPHWFLWALCTCVVTLSVGYLCGVEFLHHGGDGTEAVLISIGCLMIYPVFLVKLAWGYRIEPEFFSIYFLWFRVQRIPWEQVSEVVLIQQTHRLRWGEQLLEYFCITIKPADPIPHFYVSALRGHRRRNLFLVWNIGIPYSEVKRWRLQKLLERIWGKLEIREIK
ncbi:MAG: hypothetical protein E7459_05965 [Ruminococcaceae bacterium]|nr:hypothetical protein [Oscillospiraceae bacterium]